jgi:RNA polymerase sigma-70 factor, ECF subfamily
MQARSGPDLRSARRVGGATLAGAVVADGGARGSTHLAAPASSRGGTAVGPGPRRPRVPTRFDAEIVRHHLDVYRYALFLSRDPAEAEDVVQDTFVRARRSWRTFRHGTDCRKWLLTICRHTFLRLRERRRCEVSLCEVDHPRCAVDTRASIAVWPQPAPSPIDVLILADVRRAVLLALEALPARFRDAVALVDVAGDSYEETARRLGIPVGTVRSRLHRGRRLLKGVLAVHAEDLGLTA